jgi:hypothetical protein
MLRAVATCALLLLAAPARAAGDDAGAAAAQSYTIETGDSSRKVKVGQSGKLVLAIQPKDRSKVHVDPRAPLKIRVEPSAGLQVEKTQLGKKDAVTGGPAEAPRFEVAFTATAAGRQEAKANLDFFVCSDTWCVKQTRSVTIPVEVN